MDTRKPYRAPYSIERTDPQEDELFPCCGRCEFCDIALVSLERKRYQEEGSRWWRNPDGTPIKKQNDGRNLICSLSGTGTVADQVCPRFRKADVIWK